MTQVRINDKVDLNNIYYPRFHLVDLISTRKPPFSSSSSRGLPPRPPNAFFLMKNAYLLELRLQGIRLAMPDLCRQAKQIWRGVPQDVKDLYDGLALQAQILHQSMYPNYRFMPKRRTTFKPWRGAEGAFQSTSGRSSSPSSGSIRSQQSQSPQSLQSQSPQQSPQQSSQQSSQQSPQLSLPQNDYNNINGDISFYPVYNYYNYYGMGSGSELLIENGFNINCEGLNTINDTDFDYSHYIDYSNGYNH